MTLLKTNFTYINKCYTLLITINKENICNVAFINIMSKIIISKVFISIVVVLFIFFVTIEWNQ
jgi:hypothetical protein